MRAWLGRLQHSSFVRAFSAAVAGFSRDRCPTMAAALAFYAAFSLAPMLVIVIAVAGYFLGADAVQGRLIDEIGGLVGDDGARVVQAMLSSAWKSGQGGPSTWISAAGVAVGASATFAQLNQSLNVIWNQTPSQKSWVALLRVRLTSFGLVIGIGFLVVVLLVLDAAVSFVVNGLLGDEGTRHWISLVQRVTMLIALTAAFAALLKFLPAPRLRWSNVAIGAFAAALLFSVGKNLFGLYLSRAGTASAFGAAGALAVLLMWLYFSSAVFLFGAEITANLRRDLPGEPAAPEDDDPGRPLG
ncbi:MAG: YihY/virulence factor BrkB family protein [Burkholderiaceae bacterium]|jgi:membrane protein|nr:YihY/virulence factor BrkB family protein [Burkholderiaceae bacterium]